MAHIHHHNHTHNILPHQENLNKAFLWGILLNVIFVIAEVIAGLVGDSMALLSDAGHNLSDVVSLALAMAAFKLALKKPNGNYTYGYKKGTILASFVNAVVLVVAVILIIIESISKIRNPQPVDGSMVAIVAAIGIVINGLTAYMFFKFKSNDLNVKGAFLHMLSDTLVSVGVLLSGVVVNYTGFVMLDSIIGIVIALVILFSTWGLLSQSLRLVIDGVPGELNTAEIIEIIKSVKGVDGVHHVHIWALSTTENAITAHIVSSLDSDKLKELKCDIKNRLKQKNISHATLEVERACDECIDCICK
ncbi:MAG: cation diffusion facilitator family transporter [Muribaculaceae bacterium]|nr:cation diffusion facilitator family transporter [Muribaculaceae bacterium]